MSNPIYYKVKDKSGRIFYISAEKDKILKDYSIQSTTFNPKNPPRTYVAGTYPSYGYPKTRKKAIATLKQVIGDLKLRRVR